MVREEEQREHADFTASIYTVEDSEAAYMTRSRGKNYCSDPRDEECIGLTRRLVATALSLPSVRLLDKVV